MASKTPESRLIQNSQDVAEFRAIARQINEQIPEGTIKILAIDIGSSCIKITLGDQEIKLGWIDLPKNKVEVDGAEYFILTEEQLHFTLEAIKAVAEELQLGPSDIIALTGAGHKLVVQVNDTGEDGSSIRRYLVLLDNPSYELSAGEIEFKSLQEEFGFSEEILARIEAGKHTSLAKLLKVLQTADDLQRAFKLPDLKDDQNDAKITTLNGLVAQALCAGLVGIPEADQSSFGGNLEVLQKLLRHYRFPPHAILQFLANGVQGEDKPEFYSVKDIEAELIAWAEIYQTLRGKVIGVSTDTVFKAVVSTNKLKEGNGQEGFVHDAKTGVSYLAHQVGIGATYGWLESIIKQHFAQLAENHYRGADILLDQVMDRLQAGGLSNYQASYHFYPDLSAENGYRLINLQGEAVTINSVAEQLATNEQALSNFVFDLVCGACFTMREQIEFLQASLIETDNETGYAFLGGASAHSNYDEEREGFGWGICRVLSAVLPANSQVKMPLLASAADALWRNIAREKGQQVADLEIVELKQETGILEAQYQVWKEKKDGLNEP